MKTYIKPFKLVGKKYEGQDDVYSSLQVLSEIIQSNFYRRKNVVVGGNFVNNPEHIIDSPEVIASQLIQQQTDIGIDNPKSRRVYNAMYVLPRKDCKMCDLEGISKLAENILTDYKSFPAVYCVTSNAQDYKAFFIFNNYSIDGTEKMTRCFKPQAMSQQLNKLNKE